MIPVDPPSPTAANAIARFRHTYQQSLHPWCVVRQTPNLQNQIVARFRRRSHAEEYLRAAQRLQPTFTYVIIFDPGST